ncbi:hypothetical protein [Williamsoniiplasma lucivorax]|uniref:Uncharacterized protein n=1 Tax=Williamsoniiplasma lucivorax TaxID=209274 RepID=A0A2S5RFR1_9MOLU|nr:hypothetical protein [Williamsoniiplasma lucivorax]PPE06127.1 hypothetical protein ELUCI_v1c04180 [Williamsoniiplasma lucivorax]
MIGEHINIKRDMLVNGWNIQTSATFMNKIVHKDKEAYYKMLIWFKSTDVKTLKNFNINFFINANNKKIKLETSEFKTDFTTNQDVLVVKIPQEAYAEQMQINYAYLFDHYYEGRGNIKIDLKLKDENFIDNEILIFDDVEKQAIVRWVKNESQAFFYNYHYQNLLKVKYKTIVPNYAQLPNLGTKEMVDNVLDEVYAPNFNFEKFAIISDSEKKYEFKAQMDIQNQKDYFAINLHNNLFINQTKQTIQEGGEEKGLIFNPYNNGGQYLNLNYELFGHKYFMNLKLAIPQLSYEKNSH